MGVAKPYIDKTEEVLTCTAGSTLTATFNIQGGWMNGYVYVDLEDDKQFSFIEGQLNQTGTDVMSYSFYSGNFNDDSKGENSAGKSLTGSARNTMQCPSFTAPTKVGDYRIRFKMDWNSIDAGGQIGADGTCNGTNGILANGGSIVDVTLRVTEGADIATSTLDSQSSSEIYDLHGRKLKKAENRGVYIRNNKKVVL